MLPWVPLLSAGEIRITSGGSGGNMTDAHVRRYVSFSVSSLQFGAANFLELPTSEYSF